MSLFQKYISGKEVGGSAASYLPAREEWQVRTNEWSQDTASPPTCARTILELSRTRAEAVLSPSLSLPLAFSSVSAVTAAFFLLPPSPSLPTPISLPLPLPPPLPQPPPLDPRHLHISHTSHLGDCLPPSIIISDEEHTRRSCCHGIPIHNTSAAPTRCWCRLVSAVCEGRRKIGVIPCSMVLTQTRTASLRDPNKFPTTQLFLLGRCCITSSQRSDHYALIPVPKQHWYDSQSQSQSHRYSLGHGNSFSTSMLETRAMRPFTPGSSSRQCLSPKLSSASKCCDPHHKRDSCAECVASGVV